MQSFLSKVVAEVLSGPTPLSEITFVLPNKRSGLFLKNNLKEQLHHTTFLPEILSIEELIKDISGFEILDTVPLVFEFYAIYKKQTPAEKTDSFENFSKWATLLLQDFNELDSNLFDAASILSYLSDTKRIEQWHPGRTQESSMVTNYLSFFDRIMIYHEAFRDYLVQHKKGYQGLVYKVAATSMEGFMKRNEKRRFVFACFNALSKSEEHIFQDLISNERATVYWDHDVFYEKSNNQSEQFFKKYQRSWPCYKHAEFLWKEDNFNTPKTIHVHGLPKNISQIKHTGTLLKELHEQHGLEDTAVILGNEKLLPTLLNSIPNEISRANITMGYDLQNVPLNSFFQSLFKLHLNKSKWKRQGSFYYKDLISLLNDPFFQGQWARHKEIEKKIRKIFYRDKSIFVTEEQLLSLVDQYRDLSVLFREMFTGWMLRLVRSLTRSSISLIC